MLTLRVEGDQRPVPLAGEIVGLGSAHGPGNSHGTACRCRWGQHHQVLFYRRAPLRVGDLGRVVARRQIDKIYEFGGAPLSPLPAVGIRDRVLHRVGGKGADADFSRGLATERLRDPGDEIRGRQLANVDDLLVGALFLGQVFALQKGRRDHAVTSAGQPGEGDAPPVGGTGCSGDYDPGILTERDEDYPEFHFGRRVVRPGGNGNLPVCCAAARCLRSVGGVGERVVIGQDRQVS